MGKEGKDYGSEYHLGTYLTEENESLLNEAVSKAMGIRATAFKWKKPSSKRKEWKGMEFLKDDQKLQSKWREFWAQTGNPPNWDAVATCVVNGQKEWILLEAKANHPEFCSPPCGAKDEGRKKIIHALNKTKNKLGVHRDFRWEGTYYQYANRLACLYFLTEIARTHARLVFLYFTGDRFPSPDNRKCPASEQEWRPLINACHLTLGLADNHLLSGRVHEVFLPVAP